jgi:hypothetical protein
MPVCIRMLIDRAYAGNETRQLVLNLGDDIGGPT